jgi:hypothetical protein
MTPGTQSLQSWLDGTQHKIRLANEGIVAAQRANTQRAVKKEIGNPFAVLPHVS